MWTLKNGKTYFFNLKLIYKTVTDVENKLMVTRGEGWGRDKLGDWDCQINTINYKIDN